MGDDLSINGNGTIYYTTDRSDPRELYGGVSASAEVYTGSFPLNEAVNIKARVLSNGTWSALTDATFVLETPPPMPNY